jgi:hypothetical protein
MFLFQALILFVAVVNDGSDGIVYFAVTHNFISPRKIDLAINNI